MPPSGAALSCYCCCSLPPPVLHSLARAQGRSELVLRAMDPFNFCIIDEVDSILIDEARTPLIISGQSDAASDKYGKVRVVFAVP